MVRLKYIAAFGILAAAGTIAIVAITTLPAGGWQRVNFVVEYKCIPLMHGEPTVWR